MEDNFLQEKKLKNVTESNKIFKKNTIKRVLNTFLTASMIFLHYFIVFLIVIPLALLFIISFTIFKKIILYIKTKCTKR